MGKSGHKFTLKHDQSAKIVNNNNRRKRKRKNTWFNPPYALNVKTNVGVTFQKESKNVFPRIMNFTICLAQKCIKIVFVC